MDGSAPRIEQMESKATTFGRRTADDGLIHWRMAAHDVRNLVRAVTEPYPGAFTFVKSGVNSGAKSGATTRRVTLWWADFVADAPRTAKEPGTVEWSGPGAGDAPLVVCGDRRRLRLTKFAIDKGSDGASDPRTLLKDGTVLGAGS
jgi:methionyl-tRNA formyltransferase